MEAIAMVEDPSRDEVPWLDSIRAAQAGDPDAFAELVHRFWSPLLGLARTLAIDEAAAEDLLQDAWLLAWRRLSSLREPAALPAWLRKIVVRQGLRSLAKRPPTVALEGFEPSVPARIPDPDVPRLLSRLPARQRVVLYLTAVEGCTDGEIARLLGTLPSTVRVHRFRARRRLAGWLKEDER